MEGLSEERLAQIENPQRDVRWAGWGRNGTPKAQRKIIVQIFSPWSCHPW